MNKLYEEYLLEMFGSSHAIHKVGSVLASALLPGAFLAIPYKMMRLATSKCYRKCFGDNIIYTSALCQKQCRYNESMAKVNVLNKGMSQCKSDQSCKQKYMEKIMKEKEKLAKLNEEIRTGKIQETNKQRQKNNQQ
jgi:hypothetical protein